jgi:hypothetical protein
MTPTQIQILNRESVTAKDGGELFPIYGSAEHRSCNSKAMRELGYICFSSAHQHQHSGSYFNTSKSAFQHLVGNLLRKTGDRK